MKIKELISEAGSVGSTNTGGMSYSATAGSGGNLLGGPVYQGSNPFRKKSKRKTENIIKRTMP